VSSGPILETRGLGRTLGPDENPTRILDSVDLAIAPGQFVALTGASGSGKSTLLYLLGALDRPTAGEVYIGGQATSPLDDDERAALRNRRLGFVFQFHFLLPEFTAEENVRIPLLQAGLGAPRARARALEVLGTLGLAEKARRVPSQLSGGEQQRVSIARALANRPEVLLADEPTGNLDSRNAENVFQIFEGLAAEGLTVVMVTHDVGLAARAARRVELKDGRVIGDAQQPRAAVAG
jgi:lipoprotein-releasing system ATP-binding protein